MTKAEKNIVEKAFENESFVDFVKRMRVDRLQHEDQWGGNNLYGYIEAIAEYDLDSCLSSEVAEKYLEFQYEDDIDYNDPFYIAVNEQVKSLEDDLYAELADTYFEDIYYNDTLDEVSENLSSTLATTKGEDAHTWRDCLIYASAGGDFSDIIDAGDIVDYVA